MRIEMHAHTYKGIHVAAVDPEATPKALGWEHAVDASGSQSAPSITSLQDRAGAASARRLAAVADRDTSQQALVGR
jgi:hypothetical protein